MKNKWSKFLRNSFLFPNFDFFRKKLEKKGIQTNAELCEKMLEDTGVAVLPGIAFGRPENELTCRLSYVDFDGKNAIWNRSAAICYAPKQLIL